MVADRILISGGTVVSVDDRIGVVENCDVLVTDGVIEAVGPGLSAADAAVIDATNTVVIPGFVDTHRHLWETVLRGAMPACSLIEYLGVVMKDYAGRCRPSDIYIGNRLGVYEALDSGITTIVDWCHCTNTPEHADAAIDALRATGTRAMFAYGAPGGPEWRNSRTRHHPSDARRAREEYFCSEDQLLTFALAVRGPLGTELDVTKADFEFARDLDARITVHVGQRIPGVPANEIQMLQQARLLGPDTTYVHCNNTPDADLVAIADSGGSVSISPHVEMIMGHGAPATARLLDHGLRPTLSVDVTTTAPGDMFTQMRSALAQGRISNFDPDSTEPFESSLTAMEVLRFATIDGARACGLGDIAGSLAPGKAADIVLVRTDAINTIPMIDPVSTIVTSAHPSNVDTVVVGGRVVKRHGRLVNVDVAALAQEANAARDYLLDSSSLR